MHYQYHINSFFKGSSNNSQLNLFAEETEAEWVEVNVKGVRVENIREFGGPWLCLELIRRFNLDYDLFLYDVTSTYFEGEASFNPLAQRGYSRDHRGDCKQVDSPDGQEVFILCRSSDRAKKERAIHDRFEHRIEESLIFEIQDNLCHISSITLLLSFSNENFSP